MLQSREHYLNQSIQSHSAFQPCQVGGQLFGQVLQILADTADQRGQVGGQLLGAGTAIPGTHMDVQFWRDTECEYRRSRLRRTDACISSFIGVTLHRSKVALSCFFAYSGKQRELSQKGKVYVKV